MTQMSSAEVNLLSNISRERAKPTHMAVAGASPVMNWVVPSCNPRDSMRSPVGQVRRLLKLPEDFAHQEHRSGHRG